MPWKVVNQMDLKMQLINDWDTGYFNITDLSQKYDLSRPTVYKWIQRHTALGIEGLKEQSRAPHDCPHRTSQKVVDLVIQEKLKNRKRGPRKIRAQLKRSNPQLELPAISTISYWLKKEGLVKERKKRLHVPAYAQPFSECKAPNDVWSMDYKGQFYLKNNKCYPFTVSDNCSRFLLGCKGFPGPQYELTKQSLVCVFREYGLPKAIRSDNGTPFAGKGIGGLSRLAVWLILLGIIPERIAKGCPQENGRHERMHRSLKYELLDIVEENLDAQNKSFDAFRYDFNYHRPHEALNDQTPSDYYIPSDRPYVESPHPPDYALDYRVRQVRPNGEIKFLGHCWYISELLAGLPVGLKEIADGLWRLQFSFYILGTLDMRKNKIIRA